MNPLIGGTLPRHAASSGLACLTASSQVTYSVQNMNNQHKGRVS